MEENVRASYITIKPNEMTEGVTLEVADKQARADLLKKVDDSAKFTSNDALDSTDNPLAWSDVGVLTSGEKHTSFLTKVSTMFKNIRYLAKMLGTTDISSISDGTVTGAINSLNSKISFTDLKRIYFQKQNDNAVVQIVFCTQENSLKDSYWLNISYDRNHMDLSYYDGSIFNSIWQNDLGVYYSDSVELSVINASALICKSGNVKSFTFAGSTKQVLAQNFEYGLFVAPDGYRPSMVVVENHISNTGKKFEAKMSEDGTLYVTPLEQIEANEHIKLHMVYI